jgi:hypothetical protein
MAHAFGHCCTFALVARQLDQPHTLGMRGRHAPQDVARSIRLTVVDENKL